MRKGMQVQPILIIEAFVTTLLILGIMMGIVARSGDFVKQETLDVQADKVVNAALAIDSMPQGRLTVPMAGYGFKYDGEQVWVAFKNSETNRSLSLFDGSYESIEGPSSYQKIDQHLMLRKTENSEGDETLRFLIDGEFPEGFSTPSMPDSEDSSSSTPSRFEISLGESTTLPASSKSLYLFSKDGEQNLKLYFRLGDGVQPTCGDSVFRGSPINSFDSAPSQKCVVGGDITFTSGDKTLAICEYDQESQTATMHQFDTTVSPSDIASTCAENSESQTTESGGG